MKKICAIIAMLFMLTACGMFVKEDKVTKAVEKQGYTNVQVLDKHIFFVNWRGCSKSDEAAFDVLATNALGQNVDLVVCAGWPFKGVTVRSK